MGRYEVVSNHCDVTAITGVRPGRAYRSGLAAPSAGARLRKISDRGRPADANRRRESRGIYNIMHHANPSCTIWHQ